MSPRSQLESALSAAYRVEREIGRGGMAVVYLAHDLRHDRPVAIKVLEPRVALLLGRERFLREIQRVRRRSTPFVEPAASVEPAG